MTGETREKILKAALELFSEKGFAAVGTRSIAQQAGVNEVTLFRLFGSKQALFIAAFRRFIIQPSEEYLLADIRHDLEYDLHMIGRRFVELFGNNDRFVRMSFKEIGQFEEIDGVLRGQPGRMKALVRGYLREMKDRGAFHGEPDELSEILGDILFSLALHYAALGDRAGAAGLERTVDRFLDIFIEGIRDGRDH